MGGAVASLEGFGVLGVRTSIADPGDLGVRAPIAGVWKIEGGISLAND